MKSQPIIGVDDIPTTAPWMISYFQGGIREAEKYKKSSHKSMELERKMNDDFGVKADRKKISKMLKDNNNLTRFNRFAIKRISKEEYLDGICKSS